MSQFTNLQVAVAALGPLAPKPNSKRFAALEAVCQRLTEPFPFSGLVALLVHAELLELGWSESRAVDVLAMVARLFDGGDPPRLCRFDGRRLTPIAEGEPQPPGVFVVIPLAHLASIVRSRVDALTSPADNARLN